MDNVGASSGVGPNQLVRACDDHEYQMAHVKEFGQILLDRKAVHREAIPVDNLVTVPLVKSNTQATQRKR